MKVVEDTLIRFRDDLLGLLGVDLFDVLIHGSYVLGDFRPHKGDLDFIILLESTASEGWIDGLFELIGGYRDNPQLLLHQLEGTAYPRRVIVDPGASFVGCSIGTGRAGWKRIDTFHNSYIELRVLGERGLSLLGRAIEVYRPTEEEIFDEQCRSSANWRRALATAGDGEIGLLCAVVHWCARTILYRHTGEVSSKSEACRWCSTRMVGERFSWLFGRAKDERFPYSPSVSDLGMREAVDSLLDYVDRLPH